MEVPFYHNQNPGNTSESNAASHVDVPGPVDLK